jgi:hypothetical protein
MKDLVEHGAGGIRLCREAVDAVAVDAVVEAAGVDAHLGSDRRDEGRLETVLTTQ